MHRGETIGKRRLTDRSVALIVNRRARLLALRCSAPVAAPVRHSAARAGIEERKIDNATGHKNLPVVRAYIRAASTFDDSSMCYRLPTRGSSFA
jgi:hypothetical protein